MEIILWDIAYDAAAAALLLIGTVSTVLHGNMDMYAVCESGGGGAGTKIRNCNYMYMYLLNFLAESHSYCITNSS